MAESTSPDKTTTAKPANGKKQRRWINFVVIALLVYAVVSQIQLSERNKQLDEIADFVDELKEEREQGPDPQLTAVFQSVFATRERLDELVALLCLQHPDDPICVQG